MATRSPCVRNLFGTQTPPLTRLEEKKQAQQARDSFVRAHAAFILKLSQIDSSAQLDFGLCKSYKVCAEILFDQAETSAEKSALIHEAKRLQLPVNFLLSEV